MKQQRIKIDFKDIILLLISYILRKTKQQVETILPILILLVTFQIFIIKYPITRDWLSIFYILLLIPAIMFIIEGVKLGLIPIVDSIISYFIQKKKIFHLLFTIFIFGVIITLLEQYYYLNDIFQNYYILFLSVSMGLGMLYSMFRFIFNISFKKVLFVLLSLITFCSFIIYIFIDIDLGAVFDSGILIVTPIISATIISVGYTLSRVTSNSVNIDMCGFGSISIITLLYTLLTQIYIIALYILDNIYTISMFHTPNANYFLNFIYNIEINFTIIFLFIIYLVVMEFLVLKSKIKDKQEILIGLLFTLIGSLLFFIGLKFGLSKLADDIFFFLPSILTQIDIIGDITIGYGPLYSAFVGKSIIFIFIFLLGYNATLAEPVLAIMVNHTDNVTIGLFKKIFFIRVVAFGVGLGLVFGILQIIYNLNYFYFIIVPLVIIIPIIPYLKNNIITIGIDYASVAVGPITIVIVASLLNNFNITDNSNLNFIGILSLCWIYGYLSIVIVSLIISRSKN